MTVRTGVVEVVEEAPRPEPEGGLGALRTERGNLPLELIEVRSHVAGLAVRTELAQGFRNPYDVPLEATYIFPLPDRAAVTRLRMEAADRVVEGVVKEREAARADYDAAIAEGKRASIAEEERPGVFTLRVGNIMPGERVVVRTTLSGRLPYEDGQATFRFPLVVAPRYVPGAGLPGEQVGSGTADDTDQVPDASRISPPILLPGFPNPVRLSIEVAVDPVELPLTGLTSSLHGVSVEEPDAGRYLVRLDPGARADRDFVLRLAYGGSAAATSLAVARDEQGPAGTFLLTVLPPEPTGAVRPRDVALVLDRSGSMSGWKMAAARRSAARIVDTLTAADRFSVLTFDDEIDVPDGLTSGLSEATDRHRFRAVQHLAAVDARGGTEMETPLHQAADLLTGDGTDRDRVLILVTDGQVGNEDGMLKSLGRKLKHIRVHTVGIDSAVNAGFLRRLATLGGGHCELVESEDRLDEAMDAIHRRIGTPLVTGLRLAGAGGLVVDQDSVTPARLPDLFVGAPLVVAGRFSGTETAVGDGAESSDSPTIGSPTIVITGTAADGSAWNTRVPAVEAADAGLAQFWARGRIRDLEDRYLSTYDGQAEIEQAIVATSVDHSVLSRFTAFVVVDTRVVNKGGTLKQVTQPVDLPDGWDASLSMASALSDDLDDLVVSSRSIRVRHAAPMASPAGPGGAPGFGAPLPSPSAPMPASPPRGQVPLPLAKEPAFAEESLKMTLDQVAFPGALDLGTLATTWLARLTAAENDTAEVQEELLAEFAAELRELAPGTHAEEIAELLTTLTASDKPVDERRGSAIAFLESLKPAAKPRRAPFWKR
ncbi:Ca-activated chloride channel family protein [Catenulispora sp. GP43]|uniref:VIT domain-containing protein n=1 Tax=Catenulispora sp. GP43 TaxID=3156263 RepID=UPI0035151D1E